MDYFIFNFNKHDHLIDSFLESSAAAHKYPKKSREWFLWKFRGNPFGETILACAIENEKIVGCVAYGIQNIIQYKESFKGAIAFENYVHPEYQRQGIFKKLIALSEKESKKRGISVLIVFPNAKSLSGYFKMEWKQLWLPEYWIKGTNLLTLLKNFKALRNNFIPNPSNFEILHPPSINIHDSNADLEFEVTREYLKWRFFTYPNAEYAIIETDSIYSIGRVGRRGSMKEVQVLYVNYKDLKAFKLKKLFRLYKARTNFDIISFPISDKNPLKKKVKRSGFIKVPNRTNMCFKILDESLKIDMAQLSLSAINFHTY